MPGAFAGCKNLTNVIIPNGFLSIGDEAFAGCTNLTVITIPDSVTDIGDDAFGGCNNLTVCCSADSYAARYAKKHNINITVHDNSHDILIAYDNAVEPTCAKYGSTQGIHCGVCGNVIIPQEMIPKKEHTPIIDCAVEPTCAKYGLTEGRHCGVCGSIIIPQKYIDKTTEHTPVIDEAVASTCSKYGLTEGSHCGVCGNVIIPQEMIPKKEHTPIIDYAVEPTCTKGGFTQGSHCSVCSQIIEPRYSIDATGHSYLSIVTPATITTDEIITYTCVNCGDTYLKTASLDLVNFKTKAISLSLESDLTMNFKVPKYFERWFENLYIEFTQNNKKVIVTDFNGDEKYYVFPYRNISPQSMNDTVTATVYGTRNGILYHGESVDFSVAQYVYGMLERDNENVKLRTLLVDLLNYGAAAQTYQNYKTNNLVNADLTDEQKCWASTDKLNLVNVTDKNYNTVENASVTWKSVGLNLSNGIALRYTFNTKTIDGIQFRLICEGSEELVSFDGITPVDNGDGTYTYKNGFVLTDNGNGTYILVLDGLYADMMQKEIYITAMRGDTPVSNTMRYSIESYAKQVQDKMSDSKLRKLTDAMMRYGISAANYGR